MRAWLQLGGELTEKDYIKAALKANVAKDSKVWFFQYFVVWYVMLSLPPFLCKFIKVYCALKWLG